MADNAVERSPDGGIRCREGETCTLHSFCSSVGCFVGSDEEDSAKDRDRDGYISSEVAGGDDCDDANADVHPGAFESCTDAVDSDCDGLDCPARTDTWLDAEAWATGLHPDHRLQTAGIVNLDGNGHQEVILTAIGSVSGDGAIYVVEIPVPDSIELPQDVSEIRAYGEKGVWGHVVGDLDGDGDGEVLITTRAGPGLVWLLDDDFDGIVDVLELPVLTADNDNSDGMSIFFGAVQRIGDWDQNGTDDFVLFSPGDGKDDADGAVFLITGQLEEFEFIETAAQAKIQSGGVVEILGSP
jgi:hypothetical protein